MTSVDWPHFNQPRGWSLAPPGDTVVIDSSGKHNLPQFAKESRAYIAERNAELDTYLQNVRRAYDYRRRVQTQIEAPQRLASSVSKTVTKMRKKLKFKKGRRRRPISASLRSRSVPFRMVFSVSTTNGIYSHQLNMKAIAVEYAKTFDEFRCTGFSVRFVPSAITSEGVYTTVLLDGEGFGPIKVTEQASKWFTRIGDMPGSVLRHCASGYIQRWRPTSPPAREWIRIAASDYKLASLYIAASEATSVVKGAIHITGSVRVRGEYNSAVSRIRRYNSIDDLDALTMDDN